MSREIWKDIQGYEQLYQISNFGNVKRLHTDKKQGTGNYERREKILSQRPNNKGYLIVDLYKNNKRKQLLVHRLVAMAFLNNSNNFLCVNHKDENKQNNHSDNLEWCSQKYNMNYGTCRDKISKANSKNIIAIDKYGNTTEFSSSLDAYRKLGISSGNIYDCLYHKRNRKTAGGYKWEFVK